MPGTGLDVLHAFTPLIVPTIYEVNNCDYCPMSHGKPWNGVKQGKKRSDFCLRVFPRALMWSTNGVREGAGRLI